MIMFFDCETNGLPKNWKAPMTNLDNWPRVIQLAWASTDLQGQKIDSGVFLVKPDGWEIPKEKFWIENGFSTEALLISGDPIKSVMDCFVHDLQKCEYLVSHNMDFDYNVVGSEMLRLGMMSERKPVRICTKDESTEWCKIPFAGRRQYPGAAPQRFKWPKLSELHKKLFGVDFKGAHDAMADVLALKDCFFELIRVGVIKLQ